MPTAAEIPIFYYGVLIIILAIFNFVFSECNFPKFVQNRAQEDHHWVAIYSYTEHLTTSFLGGVMRASHCKNNHCRPFNRNCTKQYGNNIYLVSHEDSQKNLKFLCVQFLKRSTSVFQLKTSRLRPHANKSLCYDMKLDSVPLVSNKHYYTTKVTCPLTGGFDITLFDSDLSQFCPDSPFPIRLESECGYNEGMSFRFRKKECIHHDLAMKSEQRVYCIADWTNGRHNFVVLRDDSSFRTWCLRYLSTGDDNRDRLWVYLFMDFVCDPTEPVTESRKYLQLELNRRVLSSLCVDEFHNCQRYKLFLCQSDRKHHCALTCGLCDPGREVNPCEFDRMFHGTWMQSTTGGSKKIVINPREFIIDNHEIYQCVGSHNSSIRAAFGMLRIYENGCYPRFVCGQFSRPAPSVLHYRLGNSVVWPIFHEKDPYSAICNEDSFHSAINTRHNAERFQFDVPQKSQTSVFNVDDERAVFCNLSVEFATKIAFVDRFNCTGCLSQDSAGTSDRLSMHYNNCTHQPDYVEYLCLASFKAIGTYDRLLTRVMGTNRYRCWVFVSVGKVNILPGSECDTKRTITGQYNPIDVLALSHANANSCRATTAEPGMLPNPLPIIPLPSFATEPQSQIRFHHCAFALSVQFLLSFS